MIRILDRYMIRSFLSWYGISFFFFMGLFVVIDFFNRIDHFLEARETIREHGMSVAGMVLSYYLYHVPFIFVQIAPFITLMAAMFSLTRLMKNNELVPMINAGLSVPRILLPIFLLAMLLTGVMIAAQETFIPQLAWKRHSLERLANGKEPNLVDGIETLTDRAGNRIRIGSYDLARRRIIDLDVTSFRPAPGELTARSAQYRKGPRGTGWYLEHGVRRDFSDLSAAGPFEDFWQTDITPEDILLAVADKSAFSFHQVRAAYRRDPDKLGLLTLMYGKITFPLSNVLLLLLGVTSILSQGTRSRFLGIATCFLICGAFFATDFVARTLGDRGTLHPVVAAWLPVTLFGSLGISMLGSMRT